MKDERDDQTLDLLPSGKRRGRPPTGKALSPAAKQAAYRARQRKNGHCYLKSSRLWRAGDLPAEPTGWPHSTLAPEVVARLHEAVQSAWRGQLHSGNGDQK